MGTKRPGVGRVIGATLLGTAIEWYDFALYIFAASIIIPHVFFPHMDPSAGILSSFATLAIASIARPAGAVVFGWVGDRLGRRKSLIFSMLLMSGSTVGIGLLPGYASIGAAAPVLLIVIRILQSLAVGGEWGGAVSYAVESAPSKLRALYGSFPQIGNGLGLLAATGAFSIVTGVANGMGDGGKEWLNTVGWRLPFIAAGVLGLIGLWIRIVMEESPEFEAARERERQRAEGAKKQSVPLADLLRIAPGRLLLAAGGFLITIGGLYTFLSYLPARAAAVHKMNPADIASTEMWISLAVIVIVPLAAILADRYGLRLMVLIGLALHIVVAYPMIWLSEAGTYSGLLAGMMLANFASSIAYGTMGTYASTWFPSRVRQTGLSLAYQIAGVTGGFIPFLSQWLEGKWEGSYHPAVLLFLTMAVISTVCAWAFKYVATDDGDGAIDFDR